MPEHTYTAWERFRGHGSGRITNDELRDLFNQTKAALPFLEGNAAQVGLLARGEAIQILSNLADYARARGIDWDGDWSF